MFRGDLVEIPACWRPAFLEPGEVHPEAANPAAGLGPFGGRVDQRHEVRRRVYGRVAGVDRRERFRGGEEVIVGIDEAGNEGPAGEVDLAGIGARSAARVLHAAHRDDPAVAHADGLRLGPRRIARDDPSARQHERGAGDAHEKTPPGWRRGLAPPLKGNKFVTEGSTGDIATTITKGREGAAKHYKDLVSPMPPASMSDSRLQALIAYLKGDLQK